MFSLKGKEFEPGAKPQIGTGIIPRPEEDDNLRMYEQIIPEDWEAIPAHIHMRYRTLDGNLHRGGMVLVSSIEVVDPDTNIKRRAFRLTPKYNGYHFSVFHDTLKEVYIKKSAVLMAFERRMTNVVAKLNANQAKIMREIEKLKETQENIIRHLHL